MPNVIRICVGICALALSFTAGAAVTAAVVPAEDPAANAATPACGSVCPALYAGKPGAADVIAARSGLVSRGGRAVILSPASQQ